MGFLDFVPLVGDVVNGVSNYLSTNATNKSNLKINQMNNEFNERMMDKQIAYEKEMWNANNEYNSASAQAQRWKDAGMNPTMMMSGSNAGVASSGSVSAASAANAAPMQRPDISVDTSNFINTISTMKQMDNQTRITDAEIDQLNSQAEKNRAEASEALERVTDWKNKNSMGREWWQSYHRMLYDQMNADVGLKRSQQMYNHALEDYQLLVNSEVPAKLASEISLNKALAGQANFNSSTDVGKMIDDYEKRFGPLPKAAKIAIFGLDNVGNIGGKILNLHPKRTKVNVNHYDRHYDNSTHNKTTTINN